MGKDHESNFNCYLKTPFTPQKRNPHKRTCLESDYPTLLFPLTPWTKHHLRRRIENPESSMLNHHNLLCSWIHKNKELWKLYPLNGSLHINHKYLESKLTRLTFSSDTVNQILRTENQESTGLNLSDLQGPLLDSTRTKNYKHLFIKTAPMTQNMWLYNHIKFLKSHKILMETKILLQ